MAVVGIFGGVANYRTVEEYLQLDAQRLLNQGALAPGKCVTVNWRAGKGNPQPNIGVIGRVEGIELQYTATDNQGVS